MVDSKSFVIHGVLFVAYMASVTFWIFWNRASVEALTADVTVSFILKIGDEYKAWMTSYYQCLLQFSWANLMVQCFTIWIFYNLTKRTSNPNTLDLSADSSEEDDVERISYLENDVKHIQTIVEKHRSISMQTAEAEQPDPEHDLVSNNGNRHNSMASSNAPSVYRSQSDNLIAI